MIDTRDRRRGHDFHLGLIAISLLATASCLGGSFRAFCESASSHHETLARSDASPELIKALGELSRNAPGEIEPQVSSYLDAVRKLEEVRAQDPTDSFDLDQALEVASVLDKGLARSGREVKKAIAEECSLDMPGV